MLSRKPRMLVVVPLANKMARTVWALLAKGETYRSPAVAASSWPRFGAAERRMVERIVWRTVTGTGSVSQLFSMRLERGD
jgi:hypothetical protein